MPFSVPRVFSMLRRSARGRIAPAPLPAGTTPIPYAVETQESIRQRELTRLRMRWASESLVNSRNVPQTEREIAEHLRLYGDNRYWRQDSPDARMIDDFIPTAQTARIVDYPSEDRDIPLANIVE